MAAGAYPHRAPRLDRFARDNSLWSYNWPRGADWRRRSGDDRRTASRRRGRCSWPGGGRHAHATGALMSRLGLLLLAASAVLTTIANLSLRAGLDRAGGFGPEPHRSHRRIRQAPLRTALCGG